jgi:hypothetical protein
VLWSISKVPLLLGEFIVAFVKFGFIFVEFIVAFVHRIKQQSNMMFQRLDFVFSSWTQMNIFSTTL